MDATTTPTPRIDPELVSRFCAASSETALQCAARLAASFVDAMGVAPEAICGVAARPNGAVAILARGPRGRGWLISADGTITENPPPDRINADVLALYRDKCATVAALRRDRAGAAVIGAALDRGTVITDAVRAGYMAVTRCSAVWVEHLIFSDPCEDGRIEVLVDDGKLVAMINAEGTVTKIEAMPGSARIH
ncbi:MAG: hypothetical protein ACOYB3_11510 [Azonexus sp.]